MKKTKIVSTLGPASTDVDTIVKLIEAGANIFRFNFSHGDHEEHLDRLNKVHEAEKITGKTVGIMLDTKGAEIRTTVQKNGKSEYKIGDKVRISMDASLDTTKEKIAVTYPGLFDDVHVGGHVLFDDGLLDMKIDEKDEANNELVTTVQNAGVLGSRKGTNAPGVSINLPGITEKDSSDIRFGLDHEINFIAASFVRKPQDVLDIRELLEEKHMEHVQIFPKIESQEGIDNIDEILKVSDGLMVARGDMGVEIPAENVPLVQKSLIRKCNALGMPVITATQMLDSMQENPRPTRAEASDVANAVFDGTDATMLSGESANGLYPVESVAMMAKIDEKAENTLAENGNLQLNRFDKTSVTETIGIAIARAAKNLGIKTIVAATESGYTAKMISKYRPNADILAITFDERTQRGLMVNWGVQPIIADKPETTDDMFDLAASKAVELGFAKEGDLILITAGVPVGERGTTNIMKIQLIGSKLADGQGVGDETVIGKAVIATSAQEAIDKAVEGGVLVTKTTDKDYLPAIEKSSALIVENGGLTSHAAVVGISMGIPVIVGVKDATSVIAEGQLITVDSRRGLVYRGASNAL
ncbi:pyruvate kinase [Lactiplantibacillus mudanjiangensis]|uniref:Pyruvate kinase n=1 Tax=Lactiplantibacillus mudanjiangensis TaxID=1296538 RepID=A0A660ED10_9LACO|nr:pyruvate kinase [Lactiplantibacillus mudanjiangensis]VDG20518.1 pyruvate kinase [Lactobacillus plantarum JDM1] [Lactiplantibacillus mudanjiangensis]VDG24256.1 pyruvate kinase [Lactobacillus plantarum JDM1] [Lactiplantibacillus mudanjiangensis]VDG30481.1 pyruvate kinase [Lactobacillus plantarum JDM1] [Lactiplantibacillus mudanjiangensis]VDG30744.1 pyruvate kinase [Lactobacillus plantarum JDM1] [Lactiplantibacillus mudanjiangensis]